MPKKTVSASANARNADPAAALIASVSRGTTRDDPPAEAIAQLRRLCEHNDSQTANVKKVGSQAAVEMLQAHYAWKGSSKSALDSLCRRALGRKSWGTP